MARGLVPVGVCSGIRAPVMMFLRRAHVPDPARERVSRKKSPRRWLRAYGTRVKNFLAAMGRAFRLLDQLVKYYLTI
jgi:hypothetical protein